MQSLRRAALRSVASASRSAAPKAPTSPFAARFGGISSNARLAALPLGRCFSQSVHAAQEDKSDAHVVEDALRSAELPGSTTDKSATESATSDQDASKNAIFIRNMNFDVTEDSLRDAFSQYGTVTKATIARDARGLSKGYGFVWLATEAEAAEAMAQVHGTFWGGRRVQCAPKSSPDGAKKASRASPDGPTQYLYIGNIPYETTDVDLNRLFKTLDNVVNIRVAVDSVTGWPRGFAHADFADVESAKRAMEKLSGMQIGGRDLRLDYAQGPPPNRRRSS